ncbi:MAG: Flp pilus assembly protein TadD [bacterium]|jgi:Flp pilus assembly protein TadD
MLKEKSSFSLCWKGAFFFIYFFSKRLLMLHSLRWRKGFIYVFVLLLSFSIEFTSTYAKDNKQKILQLRKQIQYKPDNFKLRIKLGKLYLLDGYLSLSKKEFLEAQSIDPSKSASCYWLGRYYQKKKQYKKARRSYSCAIKIYPRFRAAHSNLKLVEKIISDSKDLVIEKKRLFLKQPNLMNLIILKGELEKQKNGKRFIQIFQELRPHTKLFPITYLWIANAAQQNNQFSLALKNLLKFEKQSSSTFKTSNQLAQIYYYNGDYTLALQYFKKSEKLLSETYYSKEKKISLQASFQNRIKLIANIQKKIAEYQQYFAKQQITPEHFKSLKQLQKQEKNSVALANLLLSFFVQQKDTDGFSHYLNQFIQDQFPFKKLIHILKQLHTTYPKHLSFFLSAADAYGKRKDYTPEARLLQMQEKEYGKTAPLLIRLARIHHRNGDLENALQSYEKAEATIEAEEQSKTIIVTKNIIFYEKIHILRLQNNNKKLLQTFSKAVLKGQPSKEIIQELEIFTKNRFHDSESQFLLFAGYLNQKNYIQLYQQFEPKFLLNVWLLKLQKLIEARSKEQSFQKELWLIRAKLFAYQKNSKKTEEILTEVVKAIPQEKMALFAVAQIHEVKGNYQKATYYYQQLIQKNPKRWEVRNKLALLYEKQNQWNLSLKQLDFIAKYQKLENPNRDWKRVELSLKLKKTKFAIRVLEQLTLQNTNQKQVFQQLAPLYEQDQNYKKAKRAYRQGILLGIQSPIYQNNYAALLMSSNDYYQAHKILRRLIKYNQDNSVFWYNYALASVTIGNLENIDIQLLNFIRLTKGKQSISTIQYGLRGKKYADHRQALVQGYLYYWKGNHKLAEQEFQKTDFSHDALAFYHRIENLIALKAWEQIQKLFKESPFPKDEHWYYWKGMIAEKQKNQKEADLFFQDGLKAYPDSFLLRKKWAVDAFKKGKMKLAQPHLEWLQQKSPQSWEILNYLGQSYQKQKKYIKARKVYLELLQYYPNYISAIMNLAFIAEAQKEMNLAQKYYKKMIFLKPESSSILYNYGLFLIQKKDFKEASLVLKTLEKRSSYLEKPLRRLYKLKLRYFQQN